MIFLAQKDESVELLKQEKRIHCDPGMERALKSLTTAEGRYAELVLHGPDGWRVARLVLDAWSVALFSSRGPAFAAVENLKAAGLTTLQAIDRLAGDARHAGTFLSPGTLRRRAPVRSSGAKNPNSQKRRKSKEMWNDREDCGTRGRASDGKGTEARVFAWPEDPAAVSVTDIDFEALAHVLANCCRRGGHMRHYHSLAAHAVIVSEEIEALDGLEGEDRRTLALHALIAGAASAWFRGAAPLDGEGAGSARAADRIARLAAGIEAAVREAAGSIRCWTRNGRSCCVWSTAWRPRPRAGTCWRTARRARGSRSRP